MSDDIDSLTDEEILEKIKSITKESAFLATENRLLKNIIKSKSSINDSNSSGSNEAPSRRGSCMTTLSNRLSSTRGSFMSSDSDLRKSIQQVQITLNQKIQIASNELSDLVERIRKYRSKQETEIDLLKDNIEFNDNELILLNNQIKQFQLKFIKKDEKPSLNVLKKFIQREYNKQNFSLNILNDQNRLFKQQIANFIKKYYLKSSITNEAITNTHNDDTNSGYANNLTPIDYEILKIQNSELYNNLLTKFTDLKSMRKFLFLVENKVLKLKEKINKS